MTPAKGDSTISTSKKRILVMTADLGSGHRRASEALIAALEQHHPDRCEAIIVNPLDDESTPSMVQQSQTEYDWIARDWPQLHELSRIMSGKKVSKKVVEMAHSVVLYEAIKHAVKQHTPDAIVTTYPTFQAPLITYLKMNQMATPVATIVTDFDNLHTLWFDPQVDLCLVPSQAAADSALKNGLQSEQVRITGIPLRAGFEQKPDDIQAVRRDLGWEPEMFTLLTVGSERVQALEQFIHVVNHAGHPIQLVIAAGGNDGLKERLEATPWHIPTHIYGYVEEMPTFMHAADGLLTKAGGIIVSEALAAGLPMLIMQTILAQEVGNADYLVSQGAGDLTEEPLLLLEALCHWLVPEAGALYQKRAANAAKLGHPHAAEESAALVMELAEAGRSSRTGFDNTDTSPQSIFQQFGVNT